MRFPLKLFTPYFSLLFFCIAPCFSSNNPFCFFFYSNYHSLYKWSEFFEYQLSMSGSVSSGTNTPEVERPSVSSYQVFNFVANIVVIIVLLVLFVLFETVLEPFKRGFFCDDESIAKPYRSKETISAGLLTVLAIIFILIVVSIYIIF